MVIRSTFSPMSSQMADDALLFQQIFGAHTSIQNYQAGYYCGLFVGSGGRRKSNMYGDNAGGGSGAVLDCIICLPETMTLEIACYAYNATGKFTYIRDVTGLTAEEIAAQEEDDKKYIVQVGCGDEAKNEWGGGAGGKFGIINTNYVKYIRDQKVGNDGGSRKYVDSPWGKIGCSNWNYGTDKSLMRKGKQNLASDGYLELWYIGNLSQPKLTYIPLMTEAGYEQDFYPDKLFPKSELGL